MRLRPVSSAVLALALSTAPAFAAGDAERAEALRSAVETLKQAIATLEGAADTLEQAAAGQPAGDGDAAASDKAGSGGETAASGSGDAAEPAGDAAAGGGEVTFLHALDNVPIEFDLRPDQEITPAVEAFHRTAENPYRGDEAAIAEGKKLYAKLCKACHLEDGTGRIGPNLIDDNWKYDRTATDKGKFEIIYAGGAGAMQAFGRRIDQDEILKVMAYLDVLGKE